MARALPPEAMASLQHLQVVLHGGDGDDIVALVLQCIDVGAKLDQRARHRNVPAIGRHHQRRAAEAVAGIDVLAVPDRPLDLARAAADHGGMQIGIGGDFLGAWRRLRLRGEAGRGEHRLPRRSSLAAICVAMNPANLLFSSFCETAAVTAGALA